MGIFWGFALIWIGLAYLGSSMGWWDLARSSSIWMYWPLILIFAGVSALLKGKKYAWVVMTMLMLISSFFIYEISFSDNPYFLNKNWRQNQEKFIEKDLATERAEGVEGINYKLLLGANETNISGTTQKALEGRFVSNFLDFTVKSSVPSKTQLIELENSGQNEQTVWFNRGLTNKLEVALNKDLPIALEINAGASTLNLDLSEYILRNFLLSSGASDIYVKIGEKVVDGSRMEINTGASSLKIDVPKSIGVRIKSDDGLSAKEFAEFTKLGDYYQNQAYETAEKKIDIVLKTGVSSIVVRLY
jgi:hypothetical protein